MEEAMFTVSVVGSFDLKDGNINFKAAYLDKRFSLRLARASANLHYEFGSNRPTELLGIDLRNTEESILEAAETMVEKGWVKPRT
jgi:hypothetical protein